MWRKFAPAIALALSVASPAGAVEPEPVAPAKTVGETSAGKRSVSKTSGDKTWARQPRVRIGATARYRGGPYGFLPGVRSPEAIALATSHLRDDR